jgi:phage tail sheath protein FI
MPGIKVLDVKNISATAVVVTSNTVIGIVGTAFLTNVSDEVKAQLVDESKAGLLRFSNAEEALAVFKDSAGTLREDLYDINEQNVKSPIIISLVEITEAQTLVSHVDFYGEPEIKTKILEALGRLKMAKTVHATKVRIPLVGWFTHDEAILDAYTSYLVDTKTIGVANLLSSNMSEANVSLKALASSRYLVVPFYRKVWSIFDNADIVKPYTAIIAGHLAYWDAKNGEFGTCFDHANRPIYNMGNCVVPLFYQEGENTCDVNVITNAGGCLCINDEVMGNILYNFESPSDDTRFNKLETMRYFDLVNEESQKSLVKHKHRPTSEVLNLACADIEAFLLKSKRAGATAGFEVWWSDRNSATDISAGILYLDYKAGNNIGVRTIVLQGYATTEYYTVDTK